MSSSAACQEIKTESVSLGSPQWAETSESILSLNLLFGPNYMLGHFGNIGSIGTSPGWLCDVVCFCKRTSHLYDRINVGF